jgi:hypothetical protein
MLPLALQNRPDPSSHDVERVHRIRIRLHSIPMHCMQQHRARRKCVFCHRQEQHRTLHSGMSAVMRGLFPEVRPLIALVLVV